MDYSFVDHIVLACKDLEQANLYIRRLTGVTPFTGGQHLKYGTHNSILPIGEKCYLEIIAPDPQNIDIKDKWMAVEQISEKTITRWSTKSNNIQVDAHTLKNYDNNYGEIIIGERKVSNEENNILKWKMTKPVNDQLVDPIPFLLDWSESALHPCDQKEVKCRLYGINIYASNVKEHDLLFKSLQIPIDISYSRTNKIEIVLESPNGRVLI